MQLSTVTPFPTVMGATVLPTLRSLPMGRALAGPGLGVVLLGGARLQGVDEALGYLLVAMVLTAAGPGFALDDPAASTLASSPTPLAARRSVSVALVAAAVLVVWLIELVVAQGIEPGLTSFSSFLGLELVALSAVGLAVSAHATRRTGEPAGGLAALAVPVFTMMLVAAGQVAALESVPLPGLLPGSSSTPWWVVLALGTVGAAWWSRDPGRGRGTSRRPAEAVARP